MATDIDQYFEQLISEMSSDQPKMMVKLRLNKYYIQKSEELFGFVKDEQDGNHKPKQARYF